MKIIVIIILFAILVYLVYSQHKKEQFCALGFGDCGSKTIIENVIKNRIINRNEIESINNSYAESITKQIMTTKAKASASCTNIADVDIQNIFASGPKSKISNLVQVSKQSKSCT